MREAGLSGDWGADEREAMSWRELRVGEEVRRARMLGC